VEIIRIYMDNMLRNYCHLIVCTETRETIILDPLDVEKCLAEADRNKARITKIVNTHEHFDHIEGNPGIVEATGAKIYAHANAVDRIPDVDVGLRAGDGVEVGNTVRLRVLDTPGHTLAHVCLVTETGQPSMFCGDTLFNASAGNCKYGGDVQQMYKTYVEQFNVLPGSTRIYPGHDYIVNNLNFALSLEPGNQFARDLLAEVKEQDPDQRLVTSLAMEKEMNPFFRLDNQEIIRNLRDHITDLQSDPQSVFIGLRSVRDDW